LRSEFDYLTFRCCQIFRPLLLNYAANAKTYIGGQTNLLESCYGGWIIPIWGYMRHLGGLAPKSPLSLPLICMHQLAHCNCRERNDPQ